MKIRRRSPSRRRLGTGKRRGVILSPRRASDFVLDDACGVSREGYPHASSSGRSSSACGLADVGASPHTPADPAALACVRDMLRAEQQLMAQLDATRDRLITCLDDGRRSGAAWTTIARAVIGRPASVAEVRRLASTLANRHWRR